MKKITIIGAGIGGLTATIALRKRGFDVEIFENTSEFKKAGSGINLAINAMQVFKRLGVDDDILAQAHVTKSMNLRNKNLGILGSADMTQFQKELGVQSVAIQRTNLHKVLLQHLENVEIHLNKSLESLHQSNGKVDLLFTDGSTHTAEIVIGADGIHSVVRQSIVDNSELRDAKQVCWRGISSAALPRELKGELNELWGRGNRFGFVHINDHQVYWFALINKHKYTQEIDLMDEFSDYHPIVDKIIFETPHDSILCNEIWDLKPNT